MSARAAPLGDTLDPTIDRFRALAAASGDALLTEGPVHPDHKLLGICGDALHLLKRAQKLRDEDRAMDDARPDPWTESDRAHSASLWKQREALLEPATQLLRQASKLRATTPAGIYAKALLVRLSPSGSPKLAVTLAEELIECADLRASLWPTEASSR